MRSFYAINRRVISPRRTWAVRVLLSTGLIDLGVRPVRWNRELVRDMEL